MTSMKRTFGLWGLLFPAGFWLLFFFIMPLGLIVVYSFAQRGLYGGIDWVFTWKIIPVPLIRSISSSSGVLWAWRCLQQCFACYVAIHWPILLPLLLRA